MNNDLFEQAKAASEKHDYDRALRLYTACLQDATHPFGPGEAGLVYHQIGNCLVKLKNHSEAIQAYTQATADAAYDAVGTVNYNLGMSYAALRDYNNAIKHFEIAVSDGKYLTPYKAYSAMGNALLKKGKSAEAGVAFREAALDEANPDPTKALLNLGICFMSLSRPADAVASYESALQFDMKPAIRKKLYANLGQAYVASGQMQNAVDAFETALADKTYFLSDSASVDYQRAVAAVSQGTAEITQALPVLTNSQSADTSGLDVEACPVDSYATVPAQPVGSHEIEEIYAEGYGEQPYENSDDHFFNASDEELEQWSKGIMKADRKRRSVGLKILVTLIIVIVLVFGAGVFLYTQGYGYPTQESVATQLFADPEGAVSTQFTANVSTEDATKMISTIPADSTVVIEGVNKHMSTSTVFATATMPQGGKIQYQIDMVRDMIGWKISSIEVYHPSEH